MPGFPSSWSRIVDPQQRGAFQEFAEWLKSAFPLSARTPLALGSQAIAGGTGEASDAGHVHPLPTAAQVDAVSASKGGTFAGPVATQEGVTTADGQGVGLGTAGASIGNGISYGGAANRDIGVVPGIGGGVYVTDHGGAAAPIHPSFCDMRLATFIRARRVASLGPMNATDQAISWDTVERDVLNELSGQYFTPQATGEYFIEVSAWVNSVTDGGNAFMYISSAGNLDFRILGHERPGATNDITVQGSTILRLTAGVAYYFTINAPSGTVSTAGDTGYSPCRLVIARWPVA